jgi:ATP/maltotriose-dependent transcriptional regulator MalT
MWNPRISANLAIARLRLGDLDVKATLESAADDCRQNAERYQLTRCLEGLAELALARGEPAAALAHAGELLSLAQPGGLKELVARARRWRGAALLAQGDAVAGHDELSKAERLATEIGHAGLLADIRKAG